jgi:predicted dinucleotide-binding enzyme
MRIGILGTGDVGRALGRGFLELGHEVVLGARESGNAKAEAFARQGGTRARAGTFAEAAAFGELVVLATLGIAWEEAIFRAGIERFAGKIVFDTTNPLDFPAGGGLPKLAYGWLESAGEKVQGRLADAHVVKVFNSVGNALMFRPELPGGPPTMFIAGNDDGAKAKTAEILADFGWETSDLGGIEASRYLEPLCMVWVLHGAHAGTWSHAFKMLRR